MDDFGRSASARARDLPDARGFRELLSGLNLTEAEWATAAWLTGRTRQYRDILAVVGALGTHAFISGHTAARKVEEHVGGGA